MKFKLKRTLGIFNRALAGSTARATTPKCAAQMKQPMTIVTFMLLKNFACILRPSYVGRKVAAINEQRA